jgi:hypothetical protein
MTAQIPNWVNVTDSQTPAWGNVLTGDNILLQDSGLFLIESNGYILLEGEQTPGWANVDDTQTPVWVDVNEAA